MKDIKTSIINQGFADNHLTDTGRGKCFVWIRDYITKELLSNSPVLIKRAALAKMYQDSKVHEAINGMPVIEL